ncbi:MAG: hypothetical protein ACI9N1_002723 [Flavobacteriales bacterium]
MAWYESYSASLDGICKIPKLLSSESIANEHVLVLEDLSAVGYPVTNPPLNLEGIKVILQWLAKFHSHFISVKPDKIWTTGCYWHLETRMEEWQKMPDSVLKSHAKQIDEKLSNCKFLTIVHGDAKLANFCFSNKLTNVAAVDFQYVGSGCGIKDVAYFLGSCLSESECEQNESELLAYYFQVLKKNMSEKLSSIQISELIQEWTSLYPFAWADFHRFLEGWAPDHSKLNRYSQTKVDQVIRKL